MYKFLARSVVPCDPISFSGNSKHGLVLYQSITHGMLTSNILSVLSETISHIYIAVQLGQLGIHSL